MKMIASPKLALLLLAATFVGCGSGTYNERLQVTLASVGRRAAIEAMLRPAASDVGNGSGMLLRVPALFDASSVPVAAAEPRARIGGVDVPGLTQAIERSMDDAAQKFAPTYVYLAAIANEGFKQDQLQAQLQQSLAPVIPNLKWENVAVEKLDGGSASYMVLKGNGPQEFDGTQNGGAVERLEGRFELYLVPADKHWVLVGWRAPNGQADKYKFFDVARASMGTVTSGAAPPAAAPVAVPGPVAPMPAGAAAPAGAPAPAGVPAAAAAPAGVPMAIPPMPMPMP